MGSLHMKPLLDTILFLAWVSVYLAAISWVSRYRKARLHAMGPSARNEYRADKDIVLWLSVFVVGMLLLILVYIVTSTFGKLL